MCSINKQVPSAFSLQTLFTHPKPLMIAAKIKGSIWVKVIGLDFQLKSLHLINLSSSILHSKGTYNFKEIANQMITRYRKLDKRERNHFNTIKRFYSAIILIAKKHILIAVSASIKWQVLDSIEVHRSTKHFQSYKVF